MARCHKLGKEASLLRRCSERVRSLGYAESRAPEAEAEGPCRGQAGARRGPGRLALGRERTSRRSGLVLARVRAHAEEVHGRHPGHEACVVLVIGEDNHVLRYTRIANASKRPGEFRISQPQRLSKRLPTILVHSHPSGPAAPSDHDVAGARRHDWQTFGIYALASSSLRFWRLDGGRVAELPFEIVS